MTNLNDDQYLKIIKFYRKNPVKFVKDVNGFDLTEQQKEIMKSVPLALETGKNIAVKSGHGTGKTFLQGNIISFILFCYPLSKVVCTANSQHQLRDVLRAEVTKVLTKSKMKHMFIYNAMTIRSASKPDEWFCVFKTSSTKEGFAGFHAPTLVYLVDEGSGLDQEILETIEGGCTEKNSAIMMFSNPTKSHGGFFDAFHSKKSFYITHTLDSSKSPLVKKSFYETLIAKYGKDSDVVRVRVQGKFPKKETDSLISLEVVDDASKREVEIPESLTTIEIGCDVARFGSDKTVIFTRQDKVFKMFWECQSNSTMTIVGKINQCIKEYKQQGYKTFYVNLDASGVGGGPVDRLVELESEGFYEDLNVTIHGINNGSRAKEPKKYFNKAIEMWDYAKVFLTECSIPDIQELTNELSNRKYSINSINQLVLESKKLAKKRMNGNSPDFADAIILSMTSLIYQTDIITNANEEPLEDLNTVKQKVKEFNSSNFNDRLAWFKQQKKTY